jgi:hypothetical protein
VLSPTTTRNKFDIIKMKTITKILSFIFITSLSYSQSYSRINYDASTTIDIGSGADVCANDIIINGVYSGGGTICQGPLPVTLSSFIAASVKNNVTLNWVTESELNNSGFEIERKETEKGSTWKKITFVPGNGTTQEQKHYTYTDKKIKAGNYNYRIKQVDYNGNFEYFELESVVSVKAPKDFMLSQNYPNPSNPKSKIDFEIPFDGKVNIIVFDILGQEVVSLVNEFKSADYYTVEFDGSNLASGMYFYRITAEGNGLLFNKTMKMIIVK